MTIPILNKFLAPSLVKQRLQQHCPVKSKLRPKQAQQVTSLVLLITSELGILFRTFASLLESSISSRLAIRLSKVWPTDVGFSLEAGTGESTIEAKCTNVLRVHCSYQLFSDSGFSASLWHKTWKQEMFAHGSHSTFWLNFLVTQ